MRDCWSTPGLPVVSMQQSTASATGPDEGIQVYSFLSAALAAAVWARERSVVCDWAELIVALLIVLHASACRA